MCRWLRAIFRRCRQAEEGEEKIPIRQVEVEELWHWLDGYAESAPLLVDVRPVQEYEREHILGSRLLPLPMLDERCEELLREQQIVLICRGGTLSQAACELLVRRGFAQVSNLRGGILSWKRAGLPYVAGCHSTSSDSTTTAGAASTGTSEAAA
ncbi:MAG: rhodanese-like domain-containing protein [Anaerolineae bacterium]|nr:rhodanese-like domain-containing protein [Anaerolineae bacterium]